MPSPRDPRSSSRRASLGGRLALTGLTLALGALASARGQEPPAAAPAATVDFARDIKPILARRCFACHGPSQAEGGLRLHERKAALAPLDSGEVAIVPGQIERGELLRRVLSADADQRMPPEGEPLSAEQIALLKKWIAEGAPWEAHWAFRPVAEAAPPVVNNPAWVRNPIDLFVLRGLERRGFEPAPEADRRALYRRLHYGLTGLPPTFEEVEAFAADPSPTAYEDAVERLLASPRWGETFGRRWLDLARFAETNSFERDGPKPNAWKYRDYVIRALNADKPYDRFVQEQLAGDELAPGDMDAAIALGYYRLGIWDDEPADRELARFDEFDDLVTTTGQVMLGLTINCARCHNHKIDPIPQRDYYRLLAFFRDVTTYGLRSDEKSFSQKDISPPEVAAEAERLAGRFRALQDQIRGMEQRANAKLSPDEKKLRGKEHRDKLLAALGDEAAAYLAAIQERDETQAAQRTLPGKEAILTLARYENPPPPTHVLARGSPQAPDEAVSPGFPTLFETPDPVIEKPPGGDSAGRRLVLARWITSPDNRLAARVIVNRLWQHHFGRGLVRSPNNFGELGEPPTHPELLDWLARELVRQNWSLKALSRTMVLSSTYRMSSRGNAAALAKDPANDAYWRFDMRRLAAEELRDGVLAASGRLNLKMRGPGVYPTISKEVLAGQSQPGAGWGNSPPEEQSRRSVYIYVKRSLITPLLATFDFPDTDGTCEARFRTTQPGQALSLLNGEFLHEQAGHFADRVRREAGPEPAARARRAIEAALTRPAAPAEIERAVRLLETLQTKHAVSADEALRLVCLTILNLNEFVYLD